MRRHSELFSSSCRIRTDIAMGNFISPLRRAIRKNDYKEAELILDEAGEGAADLINEDYTADCFLAFCQRNVQNPLHTALGYQGRERIVHLLIQKGADVNSAGQDGQTPLHKAAKQNNLSFAEVLVESGADIHGQDDKGWSPVHCASMSLVSRMNCDLSVLRFLVEQVGATDDVHLKDDAGNTPLHVSAKWDNATSFVYLLSKGADLNAVNNSGNKPLDLADLHVKSLDLGTKQQ